jgi:hypothetical protein
VLNVVLACRAQFVPITDLGYGVRLLNYVTSHNTRSRRGADLLFLTGVIGSDPIAALGKQ